MNIDVTTKILNRAQAISSSFLYCQKSFIIKPLKLIVVNYIPAIIIISLLKFNFIFKFNFFIKIGYDVCYYMFFTKEVKSVYKNQFMNLIKRELPRAVLLFGDDNFYIDRIIDFYIKRTNSQNSVLKYYFDEYNFDSIKNNLSQSSLFGDTNFIIIKRDREYQNRDGKVN